MDNPLPPEMIIVGAFGLVLISIAFFGERLSWLGKALLGTAGIVFIATAVMAMRATAAFY